MMKSSSAYGDVDGIYSDRGDILRRRKRKLRMIKCLAVPVCIILLNVLLVVRAVGKISEYTGLDYEENGIRYIETSENSSKHIEAAKNNGNLLQKGDQNTEGTIESGTQMEDYPAYCGLSHVEKPVERSKKEILKCLENLSETDDRFNIILENYKQYPEEMLESLANNPEMADFVVNYFSKEGTSGGGLTDHEKSQEYPLFLQWDPRWGYASYGDDNVIGMAGCGPTSLSMVLYYLTGDETITPDKVAEYSMENGYYASGKGTAWALMEDYPAIYDITSYQLPLDECIMKRELDQGHFLILAMRKGDFTLEGHFIVVYGYDEEGFLVNDPNCVARSRKSWSFDELQGQVNNIWSFC